MVSQYSVEVRSPLRMNIIVFGAIWLVGNCEFFVFHNSQQKQEVQTGGAMLVQLGHRIAPQTSTGGLTEAGRPPTRNPKSQTPSKNPWPRVRRMLYR
jgi:hypothetical protein